MKFEEKLQKLRKASGMNQEMLADKLGVSRQAVSKWESGASYPETDKLIQMSKIFNCTLDELVNDSETDKTIFKNNANKMNMYLDSFIEFITKSVNMFSRMKFSNLIKSFVELFIIAIILVGISAIVWMIGGAVINNIFFGFYVQNEFFWNNIVAFIRNLILGCYFAVIVSIDFIIYLQIYKIRYLDYYDKLIYEYDQKKRNEEVEEVKEEKKEEEKKEKEIINAEPKKNDRIVIRDPEHRPFAFLSPIAKFITNLFKFLIGCIGVLFVGSLIFFVIVFVISIYLGTINDLFGGVIIALLAVIVFNILLIEIVYRFVNSIKVNKLRVFIQGLMCIIVGSIGVGLTILEFKNIDFIEYGDTKYYVETSDLVRFDKNINTLSISYNYDTVLVVDDTLSNELRFNVIHNKDLSEYKYDIGESNITFTINNKVNSINDAVDYYIGKLRNNELLLVDLYDRPSVRISGNKETIEEIVKYLRDKEDYIFTDSNGDGIYHSW